MMKTQQHIPGDSVVPPREWHRLLPRVDKWAEPVVLCLVAGIVPNRIAACSALAIVSLTLSHCFYREAIRLIRNRESLARRALPRSTLIEAGCPYTQAPNLPG